MSSKSTFYPYKNKNVSIIVLIVIILLGYAFFFASPYIFHEYPEKQYTELNQGVTFGGTTAVVESWEYCKEQQMFQMSVTVAGVTNRKYETSAKCNYHDKNRGATTLQSEIVYTEEDYLLINVYNVPDDYYCGSVTITDVTDGNKAKADTAFEATTEPTKNSVVSSKTRTYEVSLYTCEENVDTVATIPKLDDKTYKIIRINNKIENYNKLLDENKTQIQKLRDENDESRTEIVILKQKLDLMTSLEQEKAQGDIDDYQLKIDKNNEKITQLTTESGTYTEEISEYQQIIQQLVKKIN